MKRYKQHYIGVGRMQEDENGQWVSLDDYNHCSDSWARLDLTIYDLTTNHAAELKTHRKVFDDDLLEIQLAWQADMDTHDRLKLRNDILFWLMTTAFMINLAVIIAKLAEILI